MSHPWLKKNPFMSLWLSAAHRVAGRFRGQAAAQGQRLVKAAVAEALSAGVAKAKPRRKR